MDTRASVDQLCVVVPALNEELLISRCLHSVLAAGVPAANIFVVNDRSTDLTAAVVSAVPGINLLTNERQRGKLGGLRHAIAHFDLARRFAFLSLLDADSHVASDYFVNVARSFVESPDAVLVCGSPSSDRHNWLTAYRALEYAVTLATYRTGQNALGVITVAPGCASTYRTSVLDRFDWDGGTLVEDMDLTVQVHRKRLGRVEYAADAVAHTQDPRRITDYVGQMTRWYSGTWQVFRLHRIPFGGQRIDAEFAILTLEGLVYGVLMVLLPFFALLRPAMVGRWLLIDQAVWLALACACAARARRLDVLAWLPTFLFLRYLNAAILLRTFWLEIVRGRRRHPWFSVGRYASGQVDE